METASPPPVYRFSGFRLDHAILEYNGELIPLTPKAFDVLRFLVSRAPAIVTKDEIFAAVWPGTFVVESSLARNISVIRKALEEKAGPGPFIETIPKRGYRFVAPLETGAPAAAGADSDEAIQSVPRPANRRVAIMAILVLAVVGVAALWRLASPPPQPSEAERIGRHLLGQGTPAAARQALSHFEQAARENPDSAAAHAGLAESLLALPLLGVRLPDGPARALAAAQNALRLDPGNADAHAAMGASQLFVHWDLPKAEASFRHALTLIPDQRTAVYLYSNLLSATGRPLEAMAVADRARRSDPASAFFGALVARLHFYQGDFPRAASAFVTVLNRNPHYALAHYYLAITYAFMGRFADAERHLNLAELNPLLLRNDRAWLQLLQGNRAPAEQIYSDLQTEVRQGRLDLPTLLLPAVSLGRFDDAFAALTSAMRERNPDLLNLTSDPRFAPLRADPRFPPLARRIGLLRSAP